MNLKEYMASDDPQMCWRLQSGDLVNLVDEATEEIERLRYVLSAAIRFGSYAMVLCQDDHVTPEYLEGYRERFRAFEAALSAEYCTRAASMTDSAEAATSGGLERGVSE
jgi:hypothetical protein